MVAEAASAPAQDQEARQASAQELQALRGSLTQAETQNKELESQVENLNKVRDGGPSCVCECSPLLNMRERVSHFLH